MCSCLAAILYIALGENAVALYRLAIANVKLNIRDLKNILQFPEDKCRAWSHSSLWAIKVIHDSLKCRAQM